MPLQSLLYFNLIGILVVVIIMIYDLSSHDFFLFEKKLMFMILLSTLVMLLIDSLLYVLAEINCNKFLYTFCLILYFLISVLPAFFWVIYTNYILSQNKEKLKELLPLYLIPFIINTVFVLLSIKYNIVYEVAEDIDYIRGDYFYIPQLCCLIYFLNVIYTVMCNKTRSKRKKGYVLLSFVIPPFLAMVFQLFYPDISLIWVSCSISCLIVFLHTQSNNLSTDYLTKLNNRIQFDEYLLNKLKKRNNMFLSVALIDIVKFKNINDTYGHITGDKVLEEMSDLITYSIGKKDFSARYGADEFIIVAESKSSEYIKDVLANLRINTAKYNLDSNEEFVISYVAGYYVLKPHITSKFDEIISIVNKKLSQNKEG